MRRHRRHPHAGLTEGIRPSSLRTVLAGIAGSSNEFEGAPVRARVNEGMHQPVRVLQLDQHPAVPRSAGWKKKTSIFMENFRVLHLTHGVAKLVVKLCLSQVQNVGAVAVTQGVADLLGETWTSPLGEATIAS